MSDVQPARKARRLGITDVVLRDASQSLLATRVRLDDMLPIAPKLDQVGFWSLESWGGATFDACIRYLGEDPWDRIRHLKAAMPNTPQQMLLRGQNILGYRNYADDVVARFIERAAVNGVDVFRIFDAMNDMRNLRTAIKAALDVGRHAQGTLSYTVSPVHTMEVWVDLAKQIEDMGAHSVCIKDMAGLLKPYTGFELVTRLKEALAIPVHMHSHATTGLSTATCLKCVEAGIDNIDTSISSMSMTYGHSPTETMVAMLEGTERDTGLDLALLEEIAAHFRDVRKKYARFEGRLRGVDSRILVAQVPGGMLTNLENQLREQNAGHRLDEVLLEIAAVRKDLGYIPLVTPTSQIVGTQAVLNVLTGERYKSIAREAAAVLRGEYGATPAPVDSALQARALGDAQPITCRPADLLAPELDKLADELVAQAAERGIRLAEHVLDDVLIYALFPQAGLHFLANRDDLSAFEATPEAEPALPLPVAAPAHRVHRAPLAAGVEARAAPAAAARAADARRWGAVHHLRVSGRTYRVEVSEGGEPRVRRATLAVRPGVSDQAVSSPLAGSVIRILVGKGEQVSAGQTVLVLEAMKMETEISAPADGVVIAVHVAPGEPVIVDQPLLSIR